MIDHAACYAATLHSATPARRSLCRGPRRGEALTKESFTAAAAKKAAPKPEPAHQRRPRLTPRASGDDPLDEADVAATTE